jgi:hypothetical protein
LVLRGDLVKDVPAPRSSRSTILGGRYNGGVIFRSGIAAGLVVLAVCAPSSEAALQTFGSDLALDATIAEARPSDTAYWQTTAAGGSTAGVAPAAGSIRSFKLKGIAESRPQAGKPGGETLFHLQALRALSDSAYRVLITSQGFDVPHTGVDQQISTYEPVNFCVAKGDVLAFNTVGGWDGTSAGPYASGTPLKIFARAPGSLVSQFNGANRTNNGDILKPDRVRGQGQELLMQLTLATGDDAAGPCRTTTPAGPAPGTGGGTGGGQPTAPTPQRTKITSRRVTVTRNGGLSVALFCSAAGSGGSCAGTVRVLSREPTPRVLAARDYTIGAGKTRKAALRLSSAGRKLFAQGNRRLRVRIQTVTNPGGAARTVTKSFILRQRG